MDVIVETSAALLLVAASGLALRALKQSVIPGYIVVGLVAGPYVLKCIHANFAIEFLAYFGLLVMFFFLGLEFSVRRFMRAGRNTIVAGTTEFAFMFTLGFALGIIFGMSVLEALFLAGITYCTSSAIVTKCLIDLKRLANPETETVLGVMIFEDVIVSVLLAILTSIAIANSFELSAIASVLLFTGLVCGGFILLSRFTRVPLSAIFSKLPKELWGMTAIGIVVVVASLTEKVGISGVIGAFLVGMLFSETDQHERLVRIAMPFKDVFVAVFFFAFGMEIDVGLFSDPRLIIMLAIAVMCTIVFAITAGRIAGRACGFSKEMSINLGYALMSKGEFSVLLASISFSLGLEPMILAFTGVYVLVLSILGPYFMENGQRIDRLLFGDGKRMAKAKWKPKAKPRW